MLVQVELTKEEAEVVDNYIFRKVIRLEESNLKDSYCYPKLLRAHNKLVKAKSLVEVQEKERGN